MPLPGIFLSHIEIWPGGLETYVDSQTINAVFWEQ